MNDKILKDTEKKFKKSIKTLLGENISYKVFFDPLYIHSIDEENKIVYFGFNDPQTNPLPLQSKYSDLIIDELQKILNEKYTFIVKKKEEYNDKRTSIIKKESDIPNINVKYTFENFVAGPSNKLALAASLAVAEMPSDAYNPLFLYGGSGLGKTHLMHAIVLHITKENPYAKVIYISSEQFTSELITAIQENKTAKFKNKYRKADVLLIDDIQFLEKKVQTQEEFFYTFNALYEAGKQIVISSDRPPNNLSGIEDRLRSRFSWNMIADIQPPDYETRVAILYKKLENAGIQINSDIKEVCSLIAEKITDNIRELEGALSRVISFSNLLGEKITTDLAKNVLKDIIKSEKEALAPERIRSAVSKYYKIKISDMDSSKRNANITLARQVAMYLCREYTELSHEKIGKIFGNKHYSTVIYSHAKIRDAYETDEKIRNDVNEIIKMLTK